MDSHSQGCKKEAAILIDRHDISCLAALQDEKIIGAITDRDIIIRVIAAEKDPKSSTVREMTTNDPIFCRADNNMMDTFALRIR